MHRIDNQAESRNPGSDSGFRPGGRSISGVEKSASRTQQSVASVCSWCQMVRGKRGIWIRAHSLLFDHPELIQTHGVCPECIRKHFPHRVSVA